MRWCAPVAALVAALGVAWVGASAASANNFPIYQCPWTSPSLGTSYAGNPIYVYDGGGIHQPLTLHFGWGASSERQVLDFLAAQYSLDGGTITDSNGNVVWSYETTPFTGWGIGLDQPPWTAPFASTGMTPGGQIVNDWATVHNVPIPALLPGVYTLSFEVDLSARVLDGYTTAKPGAVYRTTNCTFTVQ